MKREDKGMIARVSFTGDGITRTENKPLRRTQTGSKGKIAAAVLALTAIGLLAFALAPANPGSAQPSRESDCTICHDTIVASLLTVTGLPSDYTPGNVYTITIQVNDLNGGNGENGFYMTTDAGQFSNPGANAEVNSLTTASTVDTRPRPETSWTVDWTAPASGTATITVYAVSATDTETGSSAPSDSEVIVVPATAIPEFTALLLPIAGIAIVIIGAAKLTKRTNK